MIPKATKGKESFAQQDQCGDDPWKTGVPGVVQKRPFEGAERKEEVEWKDGNHGKKKKKKKKRKHKKENQERKHETVAFNTMNERQVQVSKEGDEEHGGTSGGENYDGHRVMKWQVGDVHNGEEGVAGGGYLNDHHDDGWNTDGDSNARHRQVREAAQNSVLL